MFRLYFFFLIYDKLINQPYMIVQVQRSAGTNEIQNTFKNSSSQNQTPSYC